MKLKYNNMLVVSSFLLFLALAGTSLAARTAEVVEKKPGVGMQFVNSFTCIFTQCGWPAIVILILPAIAIYIWKKVFSWG